MIGDQAAQGELGLRPDQRGWSPPYYTTEQHDRDVGGVGQLHRDVQRIGYDRDGPYPRRLQAARNLDGGGTGIENDGLVGMDQPGGRLGYADFFRVMQRLLELEIHAWIGSFHGAAMGTDQRARIG